MKNLAMAFELLTARERRMALWILPLIVLNGFADMVGVALIFIMFGAPDVAITQLLVEVLQVVLVAVAMLKLPSLNHEYVKTVRMWDLLMAAAIGVSTTIVLLSVMDTPFDLRLTEFFEQASAPIAYGRNIVNVILVDFRALDTFGEIAVVVIAALGAFALLRGTRRPSP